MVKIFKTKFSELDLKMKHIKHKFVSATYFLSLYLRYQNVG